LYNYQDEKGYTRFYITLVSRRSDYPLISFTARREATSYMERMAEEYELCKKLCDLYQSKSACFLYTVKSCHGACVEEESSASYNARCHALIDELSLKGESFYVVDKGRGKNEKSLVFVKNGFITGMGYAPFHFNSLPPNKWDKFLTYMAEDRDARSILKLFLRKNKKHEIIRLKVSK